MKFNFTPTRCDHRNIAFEVPLTPTIANRSSSRHKRSPEIEKSTICTTHAREIGDYVEHTEPPRFLF